MKKFTQFKATLILMGILGFVSVKANHLSDRLTFSARMQAAPGVTTNANGVAAFMLNSTRDTMYFTASFAKLSSALTGFHIHNGRTGGNVIIDFAGKVQGNTIRSFISGTQLNSLMGDFMEGNLYIAVHTVTNPAVEILGSIKLETDWSFEAVIDGTQASTISLAKGLASINFGLKGDTVVVKAVTNLSNKIVNVHLHHGKMGQNGGVILGLNSILASDSVSLVGGITLSASTWTTLMACLMSDSVYINFHTTAFAGGEIRGQLRSSKTLRFDAWLNQKAIVDAGGIPAVVSSAYGVATLMLNKTMDTLSFQVMFSGLLSTATGAHFHNAGALSSGAVKTLVMVGNNISGIWTANDTEPFSNAMLSELLKGNLYFAVHTTNNPGGEIRGQVFRSAREGFIAEIDGAQASTSSVAKGTAIATYDRDRTNLHIMAVCDGLQGTFSAGHIHAGLKGQSGGVIIDMNPFTNNGSYLFAKAAGGFTLSNAIAMATNDSTYINIHSSVFASGEIRGQLMRYYRISSPSIGTGINQNRIADASSVKLYPNPVTDVLNVKVDAIENAQGSIRIYDINGKILLTTLTTITPGSNDVLINTQNLNPGIYFAEISLNGALFSHTRFVKN
ncbi:MAG: CHRD domain-containing protein [Bacteroidota bacterium]|nr:CHRD domain-containing protein [Bacteroidota bacterium]